MLPRNTTRSGIRSLLLCSVPPSIRHEKTWHNSYTCWYVHYRHYRYAPLGCSYTNYWNIQNYSVQHSRDVPANAAFLRDKFAVLGAAITWRSCTSRIQLCLWLWFYDKLFFNFGLHNFIFLKKWRWKDNDVKTMTQRQPFPTCYTYKFELYLYMYIIYIRA